MTDTMSALRLHAPGDLRLDEVPIPSPGVGDVLVKVHRCGICGTDLHIAKGHFPAPNLPLTLGHEFSGTVVALGNGVSDVAVGARVVVDINIACGHCYFCTRGQKLFCPSVAQLGVHRAGGLAEYVTAPATNLHFLPSELSLDTAAYVEPLACAIHGQDRIGIRSGDSVLVIGGGPMGLAHIALARMNGAAKVIVSEPNPARRALAERLGADITIDPTSHAIAGALKDLTGGIGPDVVIEAVGSIRTYEKMATLFAGQDSSFDIFNLDYNWIPEFGKAGNLVPMDDAITAEDKADFLPLATQVATWDGKLLGIPQTIHPALLWYRSDLYGDSKVQADYKAATGDALTPPKTMDEWAKQVKFFNGRTYNGVKLNGWAAQAAKGFGNVHTWLSFCYSYDCAPFNSDFTASNLASPQAKAATAQWAEMMKYMPEGANQFTYDNVTAAAQQGTIATAIQWSWGAFAVDDPSASKTVGKWSFTQIPAGPTGKSSSHLAEWVISVSKYSKNIDEAKKFAAWLETKENDVFQADNGGGDPVRTSSYSNSTLTEQKVAGSDALRFRRLPEVLTAMKSAQPRPFFPAEEGWETILSTQLSAISQGQSSVDEGLAAADAAVNKYLGQ